MKPLHNVLGHTDKENADIKGHMDTENADMMEHTYTENADFWDTWPQKMQTI